MNAQTAHRHIPTTMFPIFPAIIEATRLNREERENPPDDRWTYEVQKHGRLAQIAMFAPDGDFAGYLTR